ncbi:MAG: stage II sporulation protein M [Nitrososphaeria archaeon]
MSKWRSAGFVATVIVVFFALYAVMYFSSVQAYNNSFSSAGATVAKQTYQLVLHVRHIATWVSIFLNNFEVSIVLIIPIIGFLYFFTIMWNTGQIIGMLAAVTGYSPFAYLMGISFPVGILETSAYTVLAAEILYVTSLWFNEKDVKGRLLHDTWKSFILYLALLFVAAYLEALLMAM